MTAAAAVLFPRLNAVLYDHERIYQVDREAAILIPIIVLVTFGVFAVVCGRALRASATNTPATAGLASGIVAVISIVAFWISAPIVLGGLAVTLALAGLERAELEGGRRRALAGLMLGSVAAIAGAALWLAGI
jgi:hypothetical protein